MVPEGARNSSGVDYKRQRDDDNAAEVRNMASGCNCMYIYMYVYMHIHTYAVCIDTCNLFVLNIQCCMFVLMSIIITIYRGQKMQLTMLAGFAICAL